MPAVDLLAGSAGWQPGAGQSSGTPSSTALYKNHHVANPDVINTSVLMADLICSSAQGRETPSEPQPGRQNSLPCWWGRLRDQTPSAQTEQPQSGFAEITLQ